MRASMCCSSCVSISRDFSIPTSETIPFPRATSLPASFPSVAQSLSWSRISSLTWKARQRRKPNERNTATFSAFAPASKAPITRDEAINQPVFSSWIRRSSSSESVSCRRNVSLTCPRATPISPIARAISTTDAIFPDCAMTSNPIV